jgi:hypothetical protein
MPRPKNHTPRTANRFRQKELARAVRAAKDAGGDRVEVDPETGKISIVVGKRSGKDATPKNVTPRTSA